MKFYLLFLLFILPFNLYSKDPDLILKTPEYITVSDEKIGGVWILDGANSRVKYCRYIAEKHDVLCSKFKSVHSTEK